MPTPEEEAQARLMRIQKVLGTMKRMEDDAHAHAYVRDVSYLLAALKAREAATWRAARIIQQSHLKEGHSTLMDGRVWQDAWNEAVITIGSDLADAANGITVAALESAAAQQKGSDE